MARKSIKLDQSLVQKFMSDRNLPDWYRGLSQFQLQAADSLLTSIRDDSEQGTSHRVHELLIKLGITPVVSHKKLKLAMRLSRGNDLAFLWFLMELYYRNSIDTTKKGCVYTVNEQVIISTLAHLDTVPTLRELDKLLPKYSPKPRREKVRKKRTRRIEYILPYFEKQTLPVKWGKKLSIREVDNVAKLDCYEKRVDPKFVIANEYNRWFANYKLDKSKRITKRILDDQIELVVTKAESVNNPEMKPVYCAQHTAVQEMKKRLLEELRVARKKLCEKYFDMNGNLKDKSYKRVIKMLDAEIEAAVSSFKELEEKMDRGLLPKTPEAPQIPEIEELKENAKDNVSTINDRLERRQSFDYGHAIAPTNSRKFFHAPTGNKPFRFDYQNIFDLGPKNLIKDAVRTAITERSSGNLSIDNNRAIKECCKHIWDEEVKKFKIEYKRKEREKKKQKPPPLEPGLKFDVDKINPRDDQMLETMLYAAIKEMRKNKKFVLAQLPDAHKAPVLKEWMKKRYGMVYTRKEKRRSFKMSQKVFHVIKKGCVSVRLPILDDLATNRDLSYSCQKYLVRKSNYLRNKYYQNFKEKFLDNARVYWAAVRPYQCSNGPPRKEFFSYLPSGKTDIYMFRPWRQNEYMPAKEQWNRRQMAKQAERKF